MGDYDDPMGNYTDPTGDHADPIGYQIDAMDDYIGLPARYRRSSGATRQLAISVVPSGGYTG